MTASTPREARYPLTVRFDRGRVRHLAREVAEGVYATACGKRGRSVPAGTYRAMCAACMAKPNPIDCRSYQTGGPDV